MAQTLSLSIKDVPEDLVRALRERAARNHRSVQGELMSILEAAVRPRPFRATELVERIQALGLSTPAEATAIVRRRRDTR